MNDLSPLQQAMYRFIQDAILDRGLPPTNREIGAAMGIKSTGNVEYHLAQLEKKKYIVREERSARGIRLSHTGLEVIGRIAAGKPLEIFDVPDQVLDLTGQASKGRRYLLQVTGTSMIEDHIADGDYVLIDPDVAIEPGISLWRTSVGTLQASVVRRRSSDSIKSRTGSNCARPTNPWNPAILSPRSGSAIGRFRAR